MLRVIYLVANIIFHILFVIGIILMVAFVIPVVLVNAVFLIIAYIGITIGKVALYPFYLILNKIDEGYE